MGLLDGSTRHLAPLSRKPSKYTQTHNGYFVNGYKFHTQKYAKGHVTNNAGVCVRGEVYNSEESEDYYGLLDEILELEYNDTMRCSTVILFKCTWYDNKRGVILNKNKLVDVKHKSRLQTDDPFILASQAEQVFYTPYPAAKGDTKNLWAVVKTKSRHIYEVSAPDTDENTEHEFLQFDERFELPNTVISSERVCLVTDNHVEEMDDDERFEEEEFEDKEDTSDDDDVEMVLSDHSSDEEEFEC